MTTYFPAAFTLGAIGAFLWLALSKPPRESREPPGSAERSSTVARIDAGLAALAGGLVLARMLFVALHWGYYSQNPIEIGWLWEGGLSWVGGAIGAAAGLGLYARFTKRPLWPLADALAAPAALIAFASWTGCLLDGCAYGMRTEPGWLTPLSPDITGNVASRWPTQTAGALTSLAIFSALLWTRDRFRPGGLACLSLALLSAAALALSFVRADPTGLIAGLRYDTLGALTLLLAAVAAFGLRAARSRV